MEANWICPKCKGTELLVHADTIAVVTEDGAEAGELEWNDTAPAFCYDLEGCGWEGLAGHAAKAARLSR